MINGLFFMYAISILGIVLGFIALLAQKVYIDANTNQPTEIEIPFFGKLKTNFPAIAFVFFGFALAYITFEKSHHNRVEWNIEGTMEKLENQEIEWDMGNIILTPEDPNIDISEEGRFTISVDIDQGKSLQDIYGQLYVSYPHVSLGLNLITEFDNYYNGKESIIEIIRVTDDKGYLKFKPLSFDQY